MFVRGLLLKTFVLSFFVASQIALLVSLACFFSDFQNSCRSSHSTVNLLTRVADRIAWVFVNCST